MYGAKLSIFESLKWLGVETEVFNTTPHVKQQPITVTRPRIAFVHDQPAGSYLRVLTWAPINLVVRYQMESLSRMPEWAWASSFRGSAPVPVIRLRAPALDSTRKSACAIASRTTLHYLASGSSITHDSALTPRRMRSRMQMRPIMRITWSSGWGITF